MASQNASGSTSILRRGSGHQPILEPQLDPRIELLRRALELAGVEPLVAASLAQEHYGRITMHGDRFEVSDQEGHPYDVPQPGKDPILYLAERLKQGIPAKFLTDDALKRAREP